MEDKSWTLRGWPAVRMILMMAVAPLLTALVMSVPVTWLVNRIFASGVIHGIFGVDHFEYWKALDLFALWYAVHIKIKVNGRDS
jgi:ABC-type sulfate transport system permease subunit